jgi:hypothetical protein
LDVKKMPKAAAMKTSAKCTCNPGWLILALIFFAVGLYVLVSGFVGQLNNTWTPTYSIAGYFVGFAILAVGKMLKWKSHGVCPVHGGKM